MRHTNNNFIRADVALNAFPKFKDDQAFAALTDNERVLIIVPYLVRMNLCEKNDRAAEILSWLPVDDEEKANLTALSESAVGPLKDKDETAVAEFVTSSSLSEEIEKPLLAELRAEQFDRELARFLAEVDISVAETLSLRKLLEPALGAMAESDGQWTESLKSLVSTLVEGHLPTLIEHVDRLLAEHDSLHALRKSATHYTAVPDKLAAVLIAALKGWIPFERIPAIVKEQGFKDYLEYFLPSDPDSSVKKGFFSY